MVATVFRWAAINAEVLVVQCTDVMVDRPYPSNTNNDGFESIDFAPDGAVRQIVGIGRGFVDFLTPGFLPRAVARNHQENIGSELQHHY